jgi:tripartite motif-containing protein 71
MKRLGVFLAAVLMVSTVLAGFKYEGEWGKRGTGNGEFDQPVSVSVAPNGNVYVAEYSRDRIQCFTPTGSFLNQWDTGIRGDPHALSVSPKNGNVYTWGFGPTVKYYTPSGSLIGVWPILSYIIYGGEVAPNGNVYISGNAVMGCYYYTAAGSLLGSWDCDPRKRVGIAPNGDVYLACSTTSFITCYTSTGSLKESWWVNKPADLAVAPDRRVFVACSGDNVVRYYTASGSLLGSWGGQGSGPGQFNQPNDVALTAGGKRVYVADRYNYRIQFFVDDTAITPASLGRVKALFK